MMLAQLFALDAYGQQRIVTGRVLDNATDENMIGVSVQVKGTATGGITDMDGKFQVNVSSADAVLVFSYMGYQTEEVKVGQQSDLTIRMKEDGELLEEVVVIGYGTQKRKDVTTAISSVSTKDLDDGSSLRRSSGAGSGGGCSGRRTTAGGQGSGSSGHTGNFQKIATSNHDKIPLYLCKKLLSGGAAQSTHALYGGRKKPPSLHEPNAQQGRRHNIFRGTTLVYSALTDKASMLRQLLLLTAGRCNGRIPLQT